VRVHPAEPIVFHCDCETGRIASVLRTYSEADRESLADPDGIVRARCEYCGRTHEIGQAELASDSI